MMLLRRAWCVFFGHRSDMVDGNPALWYCPRCCKTWRFKVWRGGFSVDTYTQAK